MQDVDKGAGQQWIRLAIRGVVEAMGSASKYEQ